MISKIGDSIGFTIFILVFKIIFSKSSKIFYLIFKGFFGIIVKSMLKLKKKRNKFLIKFKSFKEFNEYVLKEFCKKKFIPKETEEFFQEYDGYIKNPYKPGIYRFKSFTQARKYDTKLWIKNK